MVGAGALRLEGPEEIERLLTFVYAVCGLACGQIVSAGGRVRGRASTPPMPTLPMSRTERAIACVMTGYALIAPSVAIGDLIVADAAVMPVGTHAIWISLLFLPGLVYGARTGPDVFLRVPVLAFLAGTGLYAFAGGLATLTGTTIWAPLAIAVLHLPLPTISVTAAKDRAGIGRAGSSPAWALARLQMGRGALHGAIMGPLLYATGLGVRLSGLGDFIHAPALVGPILGAILPAWPHGFPRPLLGHAATLARLPVRREVALAGMLFQWAATTLSATASMLGIWWLAGLPLGLDHALDRPAPLGIVLLAALAFRVGCASPLLRATRPPANRPAGQ
jgi:hypothetical protein